MCIILKLLRIIILRSPRVTNESGSILCPLEKFVKDMAVDNFRLLSFILSTRPRRTMEKLFASGRSITEYFIKDTFQYLSTVMSFTNFYKGHKILLDSFVTRGDRRTMIRKSLCQKSVELFSIIILRSGQTLIFKQFMGRLHTRSLRRNFSHPLVAKENDDAFFLKHNLVSSRETPYILENLCTSSL